MTRPLLLSILTDALEREGFVLGPRWHLRVQELLQRLPDEASRPVLRDALCAVTATTEAQQTRFMELYELAEKEAAARMLPFPMPQPGEPLPAPPPKAPEHPYVPFVPAAVLLLIAAATACIWFFSRKPAALPEIQSTVIVEIGRPTTIPVDSAAAAGLNADYKIAFRDKALASSRALYTIRADASIGVLADTTGTDTLSLLLYNDSTNARSWILTVRIVPQTTVGEEPYTARRLPDNDTQRRADILRALQPPAKDPWQAWIARYQLPIKTGGLLLLAALLGGVLWWTERRRPLVAERQRTDEAPYVWDIELPDKHPLDVPDAFYAVVNRLRVREEDEARRLDLPATIRATMQQGGMPHFCYRTLTRPPEYLLLIDRFDANDHRAALFDAMARAFAEQEVLIERFYFEGDLRRCWNENHPAGLGIRELQYKHPQARLMVLSSGYRLLNPSTGRLSGWTSVLDGWKQRYLLSPIGIDAWGRNENRLAQRFAVLPAHLSSLDFLTAAEGDYETGLFRIGAPGSGYTLPELGIIRVGGPTIPTLRLHYTVAQIRWIAACAVWPRLHWDLTVWLATHPPGPSPTGPGAGGEVNALQALTRLDWFVQGEIPAPDRAALLTWMEQDEPGRLRRLRSALYRLLYGLQPPTGSSAAPGAQMNLAFLRWMSADNRRERREAEREVAQLLANGVKPDFTVVRELDRKRTPLDFIVPQSWRAYVYTAGKPGLGGRPWVRGLKWALPVLLAALAGAWWWNPVAPAGCSGDPADFRGEPLCLPDAPARALYRELLLRDSIPRHNGMPPDRWIDSLLLTTRSELAADTSRHLYAFEQQAGVVLYNKGVDCQLNRADSAACAYFRAAKAADALLTAAAAQMARCIGTARPPVGAAAPVSPQPTDLFVATETSTSPATATTSPSDTPAVAFTITLDTKNNKVDPLMGTMVFVKGGTFTMGCMDGRDSNCYDDEKPAHQVTLSSFYIAETEVTQKQWRAVMGSDPPELRFKGCDDCPVERVSWNDIQEFLQKLNAMSKGVRYRLPTEAEWEYAARGGTRSSRYLYAGSNNLGAVAWYDDNADGKTHPVKGLSPNELGLYDMSGNVWEWCADWDGDYPSGPVNNPTGPDKGSNRVLRGGGWLSTAAGCRVANRNFLDPGSRSNNYGFRVARSPQ